MSKNVKQKKKRRTKIYFILEIGSFFVLILLVGILFLTQQINKEKEETLEASNTQSELEAEKEEEKELETADLSGLYSSSAILIDLDSGEILTQRNSGQIIYPASLTKMMTVLVALENIPDTSASVTLNEDIFPPLNEEGASMAGFEPGETATYLDLLYGAILPSGGECCVALAQNIAGSETAFVEKMNEKDEHTINNIRFNLEFKNAQIELLRIRNDLLRKAGIQYIHSSIDHIMARNGEDNTLDLQKKTIVGMVATRMISLAEAKILYQNISILKENTFDAIER